MEVLEIAVFFIFVIWPQRPAPCLSYPLRSVPLAAAFDPEIIFT